MTRFRRFAGREPMDVSRMDTRLFEDAPDECEVCGEPDSGSPYTTNCCAACHGMDVRHTCESPRLLFPGRPTYQGIVPGWSKPGVPVARAAGSALPLGLRSLRGVLVRAARDLWPFVLWVEFVTHTTVVDPELGYYVGCGMLIYVGIAYVWRALNKAPFG